MVDVVEVVVVDVVVVVVEEVVDVLVVTTANTWGTVVVVSSIWGVGVSGFALKSRYPPTPTDDAIEKTSSVNIRTSRDTCRVLVSSLFASWTAFTFFSLLLLLSLQSRVLPFFRPCFGVLPLSTMPCSIAVSIIRIQYIKLSDCSILPPNPKVADMEHLFVHALVLKPFFGFTPVDYPPEGFYELSSVVFVVEVVGVFPHVQDQ